MTRLRSIWIKSLAAAGVIVVGCFIGWMTVTSLWSAALGAAIALANLWLLSQLVGGLVEKQRRSPKRLLMLFAAKLLLLFVVLAGAVTWLPLALVPFLLGLSSVFIGIAVEGGSGLVRGGSV